MAKATTTHVRARNKQALSKNRNTKKTKKATELVAIFWREKKRQKIATRNLKNTAFCSNNTFQIWPEMYC